MLVSIIVRSFNEEKHIGRLLEGIASQKAPFDWEVILVDSGSTDRTVEIAQSFDVQLVEISPKDFSFGYSLNKGIETARGKYCIFISAHCYPDDENWMLNLIKPFSDENIAIVYGRQRGNEITKYSEHQVFKKWFPNESVVQKSLPFCNNANSAIQKKLWELYKFDEEITGLEDMDWAKNMLNKGYKVAYQADATAIHVHEETPAQIFKRYEREAIAMKKMFPENKFKPWDLISLLTLNILSDIVHAVGEGKLLHNLKDIFVFRYQQFYGTYKGYNLKSPPSNELKQKLYYPLIPKSSGKKKKITVDKFEKEIADK